MSKVVAVLKGGRSLEREVSLRGATRVEEALRSLGHSVTGIDVDAQLVEQLKGLPPCTAFIVLHGKGGEDGTVQELLDILKIPYTGSGSLAAMRCMDKVVAKYLFGEAGIPTPGFYAFNRAAFLELGAAAALPAIGKELGYPLVVKPAAQGSALGIKFAATQKELPDALVTALSYDDKVLLERYVTGRELAVSIVGDPPQALPVVEIIPKEGFYDFRSRYTLGATKFVVPAEIDRELTAQAQKIALQAYTCLGCRGFGRVDMMLGEDGQLWVLELNAIPGFTQVSLLPMAAEAQGMDFEALVAEILSTARAGSVN